MKKKLIIGLCLLLSIGSAKSQVTIGSNEAPKSGALLDLKDGTGTGDATASKGLGLPRVELSDLVPKTANDLSKSIGATGAWDKDKHIGLIVYNATASAPVCKNGKFQPAISEGMHVWDGSKWQHLPQLEGGEDDVRTIDDHGMNTVAGGNKVGTFTMKYKDETETYYYADFGKDAGIWMTQNLRTKYSPDGTKLAMTGNQSSNGLDALGKPQKVGGYPSRTNPADPADYQANVDANKQIGLLYDWYTATDHLNCSTSDQGQTTKFSENSGKPGTNEVETVESTGYVKGICPKGWHMPSDREWNLLEKELTEQADKYANGTYTNAQKTWTDGWETAIKWHGSINGTVMKSKAKIENSIAILSNVDSKTSAIGGFDFHIAGTAHNGSAGNYGRYGELWLASSSSSDYAWNRRFIHSNAGVYRHYAPRYSLFSVRCKKN